MAKKSFTAAVETAVEKTVEKAMEKSLPDVVKKIFGKAREAIATEQQTQKARYATLSERTDKLKTQVKSTQQTLGMHLKDLLHEIASQYISDLVQSGHRIAIEYPDPIQRLRALSRHLMAVISSSLAEIVVCFREVQSLTGSRHHDVMCMHAEYQQIWSKTIEEGVHQNVFREVDKIAVKGLLGMYFYSCLWLKPDGLQSPEDIGDVFSDLVIRSLSKGPND